MRNRIGIVGSGHVGSETANEIVRMNLGDCILVDVRADEAKALDLPHTTPIRHSSASVVGGGGYDALAGCGVVVLAAGVESIIVLRLNEQELGALAASAGHLRRLQQRTDAQLR